MSRSIIPRCCARLTLLSAAFALISFPILAQVDRSAEERPSAAQTPTATTSSSEQTQGSLQPLCSPPQICDRLGQCLNDAAHHQAGICARPLRIQLQGAVQLVPLVRATAPGCGDNVQAQVERRYDPIKLSLKVSGTGSPWATVGHTAASQGLGQSEPQSPPAVSSRDVSLSTERTVSWRLLIPNIASDQKRIWLFPQSLAQGKGWRATLGVSATTAALVALDPIDTPYFRRTTTFRSFNNAFSGRNTSLATLAIPAVLYSAGMLRHDSYAQRTALLAGEAVLDAEILTTAMKDVDRRLRPIDIASRGDFGDSWFRSRGKWWKGNGSFPSGHTIAAFSVATIVSRRYANHRWVPYVAYGAAGLIGFSRIALSSHFPSDVFVGAALGYSISRFAVLRQ